LRFSYGSEQQGSASGTLYFDLAKTKKSYPLVALHQRSDVFNFGVFKRLFFPAFGIPQALKDGANLQGVVIPSQTFADHVLVWLQPRAKCFQTDTVHFGQLGDGAGSNGHICRSAHSRLRIVYWSFLVGFGPLFSANKFSKKRTKRTVFQRLSLSTSF
jgi:hypothetical protein